MKTVILYCQQGDHYWERPVKTGYHPKSCPEHRNIQVLHCEIGNHTWRRSKTSGPKPRHCPKHEKRKLPKLRSRSHKLLTTDLDYLILLAYLAIKRRGLIDYHSRSDHPCVFRYALAPRTNGRLLNVRCECMAETRGRPSPRFYVWDTLGQADSLQSAIALWEEHRRRKKWLK